ncbi:MAG: YihY/virulence factor BrkB family protein [Clostridia bacterium]|nr:YihY/virulence factor BrkB family protein [Clostridia bacterium]
MNKRIRAFAVYFKKCLTADLITVYAAQASFYIIIAVIPFLMLAMSVFQFIVNADFEEIILAINRMLPQNYHEIAYKILSELSEKSIPFLSFSAFMALWTMSRGASALQMGVKRIYKTTREKGFLRTQISSILHTISFVIIFVVSLIMLIFGPTIADILTEKYGLGRLMNIIENISGITSIVFFTLFFAVMYKFLGGKKVPFKNQFPGAFFSSLGWVLYSMIFGVYINNFADYSYIYGSLTAIILLSLWLYGCLIIFLFGAEVNVLVMALKHKKKEKK